MLKIVNGDQQQLLLYLDRQLQNFFPDNQPDVLAILSRHMDEALTRLQHCINAVKMWKVDEFDYLHSSQYAIFLYYLSNTIWSNEKHQRLCTKIFYLNKALNGIDLFYEIEMPEIFFYRAFSRHCSCEGKIFQLSGFVSEFYNRKKSWIGALLGRGCYYLP